MSGFLCGICGWVIKDGLIRGLGYGLPFVACEVNLIVDMFEVKVLNASQALKYCKHMVDLSRSNG